MDPLSIGFFFSYSCSILLGSKTIQYKTSVYMTRKVVGESSYLILGIYKTFFVFFKTFISVGFYCYYGLTGVTQDMRNCPVVCRFVCGRLERIQPH